MAIRSVGASPTKGSPLRQWCANMLSTFIFRLPYGTNRISRTKNERAKLCLKGSGVSARSKNLVSAAAGNGQPTREVNILPPISRGGEPVEGDPILKKGASFHLAAARSLLGMRKTAPKDTVGCTIDTGPGWQNGNPEYHVRGPGSQDGDSGLSSIPELPL